HSEGLVECPRLRPVVANERTADRDLEPLRRVVAEAAMQRLEQRYTIRLVLVALPVALEQFVAVDHDDLRIGVTLARRGGEKQNFAHSRISRARFGSSSSRA